MGFLCVILDVPSAHTLSVCAISSHMILELILYGYHTLGIIGTNAYFQN